MTGKYGICALIAMAFKEDEVVELCIKLIKIFVPSFDINDLGKEIFAGNDKSYVQLLGQLLTGLIDNKNTTNESINEDIEKHNELNPKLFENNKLKAEVREKF